MILNIHSRTYGDRNVLFDESDMGMVLPVSWHIVRYHGTVLYAETSSKPCIKMHRLIMGAKRGQLVDHINGDGLDNRRANLRFATHSQNLMNTNKRRGTSSKFKGVCWAKNENKWISYIGIGRKLVYLGYFSDEVDAAKAYDTAARESFGAFCRLNFP